MHSINTKSDILIPFQNVGDAGWEEKTKVILDALSENWSNKPKPPISPAGIQELETRLGTTLPAGLKLFYLTFGLADIGEGLQAFSDLEPIQNIWAQQPEYGPAFSEADKVHLPFLISFSDYLGNGNRFCFHRETKEIWYFDHDSRPYLTKMFAQVDDYLRGCLILAQTDLFGEAGQEQVEVWTEEIVTGFIGEEMLRKWRY